MPLKKNTSKKQPQNMKIRSPQTLKINVFHCSVVEFQRLHMAPNSFKKTPPGTLFWDGFHTPNP